MQTCGHYWVVVEQVGGQKWENPTSPFFIKKKKKIDKEKGEQKPMSPFEI